MNYDERQKAHGKKRAIAHYLYQQLTNPWGLASFFLCDKRDRIYGRKAVSRFKKIIRRARRRGRAITDLPRDVRAYMLRQGVTL